MQVTTGALFAYAVAILIALSLDAEPPNQLRLLGKALRIEQTWRMFAPDPSEEEGWPVFRGLQENGTAVDPLRGAPPFDEKPEMLSETFPSFRWRLLLFYLDIDTSDPNFELVFSGIGNHLCWAWNQDHSGGEALRELSIEYWVEDNRDFEAPLKSYSLFRKRCRIHRS